MTPEHMMWLDAMEFNPETDSDGAGWTLPWWPRFARRIPAAPPDYLFAPDMAAGASVDDLIDNIDEILMGYGKHQEVVSDE